jgi:hypothetical protein
LNIFRLKISFLSSMVKKKKPDRAGCIVCEGVAKLRPGISPVAVRRNFLWNASSEWGGRLLDEGFHGVDDEKS